jgi:serine protease Do
MLQKMINSRMLSISHTASFCVSLVVYLFLTASSAQSEQPSQNRANEIPAAAIAIEQAFIQTIEGAESSVVSIARYKEQRFQPQRDPFRKFGGGIRRNQFQPRDTNNPANPDFVPNEFGTGIIIAPRGMGGKQFILTNYHVVRGGPPAGERSSKSEFKLYVRLSNRLGFYPSIIAADPRSDLALLNIDYKALRLKPSDLKPIPLGDATGIRKGKLVLALGNPYAIGRDGSASASWGIISNIARRPAPIGPLRDTGSLKKETLHHYGTLLQVDTRLNLGTSGGALLNLKGELIGITTSLAALEGYEKSVGYAVPIDVAARRIIETLAKGQEVEYGFLGVGLSRDTFPANYSRATARNQQRQGARITDVIADSPASLGGLVPGDIVLKINGTETRDRYDLMLKIGNLAPETTASLTIWRPGSLFQSTSTLSVTLAKWPVQDDQGIIASSPRYQEWRGLTIDYPTGRSKYLPNSFQRFHRAVLITKVQPQSGSELAKLQPGEYISHVNQTPVKTPAEFHAAVEKQGSGTVTLQVIGRDEPVQIPN